MVKFFPHRDDTSFTTGIVKMMGEWKPRPKPEDYVDALFGQDLAVRMAWVDMESPNPEEESKGKSKGGPSASARGVCFTELPSLQCSA